MIDAALLVFGLGREELTANAGMIGAIVTAAGVLAMVLVAVLPAYSDRWAERLGTSETTPNGPDPKEVIPGREEPIAAPSTSRSHAHDADVSTIDPEADSTAIPEPETAGDGNADDAGRAEEARQNAADDRGDDDPAA